MNKSSRAPGGATVARVALSLILASSAVPAAGYDATRVDLIDSWSSPAQGTIIIHALGHDYRAELQPGCVGLDLSIGLRFVPSGRFNDQFDRTGHIVLSDGTKCYLKSFEEIPRVKR
jgi:hypothetical protein